MNQSVQQLFDEYNRLTGDVQAAATLVLADCLLNNRKPPETAEPEFIFVEPEHCHSYNVKETALRLHLSSKQVYHLILEGRLRSFWSGDTVRIPLTEIERYEANQEQTPRLPQEREP